MDKRPNPDFRADITDALAWWGEAGVDYDFVDDPVQWIALADDEENAVRAGTTRRNAASQRASEVATEPALDALAQENLPTDLVSFQQWWMEHPALDDGRTGGRIPPRGPAGSPLMVLVAEPESGDREQLLSGSGGRMVEAMLRAFSIPPEDAYIASVLPCHTPGFNWNGAELQKLAPVTARHIVLAAPKRLLVLGFNILSLFGHELPQGPKILPSFKHEGAEFPMLAARGTDALGARPAWKAALWRTWLEWN